MANNIICKLGGCISRAMSHRWRHESRCNSSSPTINQIQVGIGGVLYPPNSLYKDVLNIDLARELSFLADDLWLYAQTVMGGHRVVKSKLNKKTIIPIKIENDSTLTTENVYQNKNDIQFKNLRDYYLDRLNIDIVKKGL